MTQPSAAVTGVSHALLRYLTAAHGLGPGSRVAVCGADAATLTDSLESLGLEVDDPTVAGPTEPQPLDAVIWVDTHGDVDHVGDDSACCCGGLVNRLRSGGAVISVVDRDAAPPAVTSGAEPRTVPGKLGLGSWFGRGGGYVVRTLKPTPAAAFEDDPDTIPFDAETRTRIPVRRAA